MSVLKSTLDTASEQFTSATEAMNTKLAEIDAEHGKALLGGGEKYIERHRKRGKLLARERIELLVDEDSAFLELCPLAAWGSDFPVGASTVMGIGVVSGVECLIVANDPTVRGGASNPFIGVVGIQRQLQCGASSVFASIGASPFYSRLGIGDHSGQGRRGCFGSSRGGFGFNSRISGLFTTTASKQSEGGENQNRTHGKSPCY